MNDMERWVRSGLRRIAEGAEPPERLRNSVDEKIKNTTRRRLVAGMGVAALVIAAAGLAGYILRDGERTSEVGSITDSTAAPVAGKPPAGTSQPPAPEPDTIVAARTDGRVVEMSADGTERRTLLDGERGSAETVSLTPDGRAVYVGLSTGNIVRIPMSGGDPVVVTKGSNPAVSPDGTRLAYVSPRAYPPDPHFIVVRDLATGIEQRWRWTNQSFEAAEYLEGGLSWAPDGRRLSFGVAYESPPDVRVLDTTKTVELRDVPPLRVHADDAEVGPGRFRGGKGTLVVDTDCCWPEYEMHGVPGRLLEVDPDTGTVLAELQKHSDTVHLVDFDRSGRHMLFSVGSTSLASWTEDEPGSRLIGTGIVAADW